VVPSRAVGGAGGRAAVAALLASALAGACAFGSSARADGTPQVTRDDVACASLGPKHPGTASDAAFSQVIEGRMRAAGLDTSVETFHMPVYTIHDMSMRVTAPQPRAVPGTAFAYSGTGDVQGEILDVGVGRETDYAGKDARGKIVLVDRNEAYHRSSQLKEVEAHGGAAMLYVSGAPDNLVQVGAVRFASDPPAPIPAVTIPADEGKRIRDDLSSGPVRFAIHIDASRDDAVGRNVIGVQRGSVYPDRYVVVGAHYDSWFDGAVDNCSGIASVLSLVDASRDLHPAYTTIYAGWDAEEPGLVGSYDWVRRHPEIVERTVVDENMEMPAASTYLGGGNIGQDMENLYFGSVSPALNGVIVTAAAQNSFMAAPTTASGVRAISGGIIPTDLQPFYVRGVQGFSTYSSTPYYHTTADTPDKISPDGHVRVTAFAQSALREIEQLPPEAFQGKEVPSFAMSAPATLGPGRPLVVTGRLLDSQGAPIDGAAVEWTAHQHDWWPVAAGEAQPLGGGVYRAEVPASALRDGGRTWVQFTRSTAVDEAQNWASTLVQPTPGGGAARRARLRIASVAVRKRRHLVRVRLELGAATRATAVAVVLRDARGHKVAGARRASVGPSASLVLHVPRGLRRGRYRVGATALAGGVRLTARRAARVR
jgi:aminopeptidase YwaD